MKTASLVPIDTYSPLRWLQQVTDPLLIGIYVEVREQMSLPIASWMEDRTHKQVNPHSTSATEQKSLHDEDSQVSTMSLFIKSSFKVTKFQRHVLECPNICSYYFELFCAVFFLGFIDVLIPQLL